MSNEGRDLDYGCRSLLQKAVRRGQVDLARKVAFHLWEAGFVEWLRTRTAVILAEECWPLLGRWNAKAGIGEILELLGLAAGSVKEKDAFALEGLAWWVGEGGELGLPGNWKAEVGRFREKSEEGFWEWAKAQAEGEEQARLVVASERLSHRGEIGLAKASAWLGVRLGVPVVAAAKEPLALPLWVGLDKHTAQGKRALETAAWMAHEREAAVMRASFWVEGVKMNSVRESEVWHERRRISLKEEGLAEESASALWAKVQPHFLSALRGELAAFTTHIESLEEPVIQEQQKQLGLF